jgi:malate dehydrogenase (oxaloacetate-decarboxylating)(NADP+)
VVAWLDLLVHPGLKKSNILVCDSKGVIYEGRGNLDSSKERYAATTIDDCAANINMTAVASAARE